MRRKLEMEILRKNGYDNLTDDLKEKFNRFSSAVSGEKICSILKFDEFCNILSKTTFLFHLRYQNIVYD
ncbi:MAG: hypothetical protein K2K13_01250, partial [Clostridiales bacterium]|nr:hypothetical protein [Clostridiales bacterium]